MAASAKPKIRSTHNFTHKMGGFQRLRSTWAALDVVVKLLESVTGSLSRQRSRVRAPSSPPLILNNVESIGINSDNPQSDPQITALDDFQVLLRLGRRPALPTFRRDHPACRDSWSCGYRDAARFPEPSSDRPSLVHEPGAKAVSQVVETDALSFCKYDPGAACRRRQRSSPHIHRAQRSHRSDGPWG
jgi:hypothetical protein